MFTPRSAPLRSDTHPEALSRRQLMVSALASGFALAVRPIAAQSLIQTDTQGLIAGEVQVPSAGAAVPAYRAAPEHGTDLALVLVVQEIFGVHEHIRDLCRRLAKQGYFAIAPELFARQGDVHNLTDFQQILPIVARVPDAQVMADLDATVAYARATGLTSATRLAITGFCWGGRIVWLYAAHNPALQAGAAWYGRLTGEATELQPRQPIDVVGELKAPVLGLYAGKDRGITAQSIEQMRSALAHAPVETRLIVYPDAEHGFNADYRPSYSPTDARAAWEQMLQWFRRHGAS